MDYNQLREVLVNTESLYNLWQSTGLDEEAFILANRSIIEQTEKTRLQKAAAKARQIKFLDKQMALGKRFLSAMVSSETYDRLCLERDRSIKSGRPKNLGDVLDELLTGSKPPDKADLPGLIDAHRAAGQTWPEVAKSLNDEGLLTSKKLSENVKLLIGTYQKQKAECVGLDDTDGRYFAAGQVSALRLVLELIEAQKTQDQAPDQAQDQPADQAQDPKPAIVENQTEIPAPDPAPTMAQTAPLDVIKIMAEHRKAGKTWPAIATALNDKKLFTGTGKKWTPANALTFFNRKHKS